MAAKKEAEPAEVTPEAARAVRDRIKEFRRVPTEELRANDRNWRTHPYAQRAALGELLEQVGIAGVLTAYHSPKNDGALTLIDGHLRIDEAAVDWPTVILDVNDEEADLLLLTLDPMAALAESDARILGELLDENRAGTPALEQILRGLEQDAEEAEEEGEEKTLDGPPEMELQTFEHYDYIVFLFKNSHDWRAACDKLELGQEAFTLRDGVKKKVGFGRVLPAERLLGLLP